MQSWPQWSLVTALWHAASEYHKQREPRQVSNHRPLPSLPTCSSLLAKITNQPSTPMRWQSTSQHARFQQPLTSLAWRRQLNWATRKSSSTISAAHVYNHCGAGMHGRYSREYCFCGAQYVARAVQLDSDETGAALKSASFLATPPLQLSHFTSWTFTCKTGSFPNSQGFPRPYSAPHFDFCGVEKHTVSRC